MIYTLIFFFGFVMGFGVSIFWLKGEP